MKLALLALFALVAVASAASIGPHGLTSHWQRAERVDGETSMNVIFAVKYQEKGVSTLSELIEQVSNPQSALYGRYASKEQLDNMLNCPEHIATVMSYLNTKHAKIIHQTGSFIKASMKVKHLEKTFRTQIYRYKSVHNNKSIVRAASYQIPSSLPLDFVGYLNHFPSALKRGPIITSHKGPVKGRVAMDTVSSLQTCQSAGLA